MKRWIRGLVVVVALILGALAALGVYALVTDSTSSSVSAYWPSREHYGEPDFSSASAFAQTLLPMWSSQYPKTALGAQIGRADIGARREVFVTPIDQQIPLVDQLRPRVPADWPVVDADGRQVGTILIYWDEDRWRAGNTYRGNAGIDRYFPESAQAELLLAHTLGGTPDSTATIQGPFGRWLLGRSSGREAGVFFEPDLLMYDGPVPKLMHAYDRDELVAWLELN